MANMKSYATPEFGQVRTMVDEQGKVWFCATDVCRVLQYKSARKALYDHVDSGDVLKSYSTHDGTQGGSYYLYVNESGLYGLLLCSRMPKAREFQRWITSEVLPSIRQTGLYATPQMVEQILGNIDTFIAMLEHYKKQKVENARLQQQMALMQQEHQQQVQDIQAQAAAQVAEATEKAADQAAYLATILSSDKLMTISQIAKDYGMSAQQLNNKLCELKVQYKQWQQYLLYQQYADKGYTATYMYTGLTPYGNTWTNPQTQWTQKGREFIYHLLKNNGILPMIERNN